MVGTSPWLLLAVGCSELRDSPVGLDNGPLDDTGVPLACLEVAKVSLGEGQPASPKTRLAQPRREL